MVCTISTSMSYFVQISIIDVATATMFTIRVICKLYGCCTSPADICFEIPLSIVGYCKKELPLDLSIKN